MSGTDAHYMLRMRYAVSGTRGVRQLLGGVAEEGEPGIAPRRQKPGSGWGCALLMSGTDIACAACALHALCPVLASRMLPRTSALCNTRC
eukprot:2882889-Rhodomonas_salina.3